MRTKKINVAGNVWTVKYVPTAKIPMQGVYGCACWPVRLIFIDKQLGKELAHDVLLHELRHAYQFETGLAQILDRQAMEIDAEGFVSFYRSLKAQKVI